MGYEVFRADFHNDLHGMTTTIGASQSLVQTNARSFGGGSSGAVRVGINNTNQVYAVQSGLDFSTATVLSASSYWETSGMTMANNDSFDIWRLLSPSQRVFAVKLKKSGAGVYQFEIVLADDDNNVGDSVIIDTPLGEHYFDLVATKATSALANDATLAIFIDGAYQTTLSNVDLYDSFAIADRIEIGARLSLDAGTTGTLDFGHVVLRNDGFITGALNPNRIVHIYNPIDLNEYTGGTTGAGHSVAHDAVRQLGQIPGDTKFVMGGTTNVNTKHKDFAVTGSDTALSTQAYIDPDDLTMADNTNHQIFVMRDTVLDDIAWFVDLRWTAANGFEVRFKTYEDLQSNLADSGWFPISGKTRFDVITERAATNVSGDGAYHFYIDGKWQYSRADVDLYDTFLALDRVECGAVAFVEDTTIGDFYMGKLRVEKTNQLMGPTSPDVGGTMNFSDLSEGAIVVQGALDSDEVTLAGTQGQLDAAAKLLTKFGSTDGAKIIEVIGSDDGGLSDKKSFVVFVNPRKVRVIPNVAGDEDAVNEALEPLEVRFSEGKTNGALTMISQDAEGREDNDVLSFVSSGSGLLNRMMHHLA